MFSGLELDELEELEESVAAVQLNPASDEKSVSLNDLKRLVNTAQKRSLKLDEITVILRCVDELRTNIAFNTALQNFFAEFLPEDHTINAIDSLRTVFEQRAKDRKADTDFNDEDIQAFEEARENLYRAKFGENYKQKFTELGTLSESNQGNASEEKKDRENTEHHGQNDAPKNMKNFADQWNKLKEIFRFLNSYKKGEELNEVLEYIIAKLNINSVQIKYFFNLGKIENKKDEKASVEPKDSSKIALKVHDLETLFRNPEKTKRQESIKDKIKEGEQDDLGKIKTIEELLSEMQDPKLSKLLIGSNEADELKRKIELVQHFKEQFKEELEEELAKETSISGDRTFDQLAKDKIREWTRHTKVSQLKQTDEEICKAIAYLDIVNKLVTGNNLRDTQILAALMFLELNPKEGKLIEISTGEGKTTIVSELAVVKVLQGYKVDVITSNSVLAQEGVEKRGDFYALFGMTFAHNNADENYIEGARQCYTADVVYGSIENFQADYLRHSFEGLETFGTRIEHSENLWAILDEVDSMLVDNGGHIVKLSTPFPGHENLRYVYIKIWEELINAEDIYDKNLFERHEEIDKKKEALSKSLAELDLQSAEAQSLQTELDKKDHEEMMIMFEYDDLEAKANKIREHIEASNPLEMDVVKALPTYIQDYAKRMLDSWIDNAIHAKYYCHPKFHYKLLNKKSGEPYIAPIDYQNTGISLKNTIWSKGLHQFLQLKHGLKLTYESLTSSFISNYGYIKHYRSKDDIPQLFGMTGTLGSEPEQQLLSEMYKLSYNRLPTYQVKDFEEEDGEVIDDEEFIDEVVEDSLDRLDEGRAVLIVCETIQDVDLLHKTFLEKNSSLKDKLMFYTDDNEAEIIKKIEERGGLQSGEIVIATNIGGRGTDLATSTAVDGAGGLHETTAFLPYNKRVQDQAFGRTSRQGKPGTAKLMIRQSAVEKLKIDITQNEKLYNNFYDFQNTDDIKRARDDLERERIELIKNVKLKELDFGDNIFGRFSNIYSMLKTKTKEDQALYYVLQDLKERWAFWLDDLYHEDKLTILLKSASDKPSDDTANDNLRSEVNMVYWYSAVDMVIGDQILKTINPAIQNQFQPGMVLETIQSFCTEGDGKFAVLQEGKPIYIAYNIGGNTNQNSESGSHWVAIVVLRVGNKITILYKDSLYQKSFQEDSQDYFARNAEIVKQEFITNYNNLGIQVEFEIAPYSYGNPDQTDGSACGPMTLKNLAIIAERFNGNGEELINAFRNNNIPFCKQTDLGEIRRSHSDQYFQDGRGLLPSHRFILYNKDILPIIEQKFNEFRQLPEVNKIVNQAEVVEKLISLNPYYSIQQAIRYYLSIGDKGGAEKALRHAISLTGTDEVLFSAYYTLFELDLGKNNIFLQRLKQALGSIIGINVGMDGHEREAKENLERAKRALEIKEKHLMEILGLSNDGTQKDHPMEQKQDIAAIPSIQKILQNVDNNYDSAADGIIQLSMTHRKEIVGISALEEDRNLHEHGHDRKYWYSIPDGVRLLVALRQQHLTYTMEDGNEYRVRISGEEFVAIRENRERILVTDPYHENNFANYLADDIKTIMGTHTEDDHGASQRAMNNLWSMMPTTLIIPLLSGNHWRVVRVQINYETRSADILYDDPYGGDGFYHGLVEQVKIALQREIVTMINHQTGVPITSAEVTIVEQKKPFDQQGIGENSYDCGPITFSNIADYMNNRITNEEFVSIVMPRYSVFLATDERHEEQIQQIRNENIVTYRRVAGINLSFIDRSDESVIEKITLDTTNTISVKAVGASETFSSTEGVQAGQSSINMESYLLKHLNGELTQIQFFKARIEALIEELDVVVNNGDGVAIANRVPGFLRKLDPSKEKDLASKKAMEDFKEVIPNEELVELANLGLDAIYSLKKVYALKPNDHVIISARGQIAGGIATLATAATVSFFFPGIWIILGPAASVLITEGVLDIVLEVMKGPNSEFDEGALDGYRQGKAIAYSIAVATMGLGLLAQFTKFVEKILNAGIKACKALSISLRNCKHLKFLADGLAKVLDKLANFLQKTLDKIQFAKMSQLQRVEHLQKLTNEGKFTEFAKFNKIHQAEKLKYSASVVTISKDIGKGLITEIGMNLVVEKAFTPCMDAMMSNLKLHLEGEVRKAVNEKIIRDSLSQLSSQDVNEIMASIFMHGNFGTAVAVGIAKGLAGRASNWKMKLGIFAIEASVEASKIADFVNKFRDEFKQKLEAKVRENSEKHIDNSGKAVIVDNILNDIVNQVTERFYSMILSYTNNGIMTLGKIGYEAYQDHKRKVARQAEIDQLKDDPNHQQEVIAQLQREVEFLNEKAKLEEYQKAIKAARLYENVNQAIDDISPNNPAGEWQIKAIQNFVESAEDVGLHVRGSDFNVDEYMDRLATTLFDKENPEWDRLSKKNQVYVEIKDGHAYLHQDCKLFDPSPQVKGGRWAQVKGFFNKIFGREDNACVAKTFMYAKKLQELKDQGLDESVARARAAEHIENHGNVREFLNNVKQYAKGTGLAALEAAHTEMLRNPNSDFVAGNTNKERKAAKAQIRDRDARFKKALYEEQSWGMSINTPDRDSNPFAVGNPLIEGQDNSRMGTDGRPQLEMAHIYPKEEILKEFKHLKHQDITKLLRMLDPKLKESMDALIARGESFKQALTKAIYYHPDNLRLAPKGNLRASDPNHNHGVQNQYRKLYMGDSIDYELIPKEQRESFSSGMQRCSNLIDRLKFIKTIRLPQPIYRLNANGKYEVKDYVQYNRDYYYGGQFYNNNMRFNVATGEVSRIPGRNMGVLNSDYRITLAEYWIDYAEEGLANLLALRLKTNINDPQLVYYSHILRPRVINSYSHYNMANEINDVYSSLIGTKHILIPILIPISKLIYHWVGLVVTKIENIITITYLDSENQPAPYILCNCLPVLLQQSMLNAKIIFKQQALETQLYNNCGPELIENFIYCLTCTRATQMAAPQLHSHLWLCTLLDTENSVLQIAENNREVAQLSNQAMPIYRMVVNLNNYEANYHIYPQIIENCIKNFMQYCGNIANSGNKAISNVLDVILKNNYLKYQLFKFVYNEDLIGINHLLAKEYMRSSKLNGVQNILQKYPYEWNKQDFKKIKLVVHPDKGGNSEDFLTLSDFESKVKDTSDIYEKFLSKLLEKLQPIIQKVSLYAKEVDIVTDIAKLYMKPSTEHIISTAYDSLMLYNKFYSGSKFGYIVPTITSVSVLSHLYHEKYLKAGVSTIHGFSHYLLNSNMITGYSNSVFLGLNSLTIAYDLYNGKYTAAIFQATAVASMCFVPTITSPLYALYYTAQNLQGLVQVYQEIQQQNMLGFRKIIADLWQRDAQKTASVLSKLKISQDEFNAKPAHYWNVAHKEQITTSLSAIKDNELFINEIISNLEQSNGWIVHDSIVISNKNTRTIEDAQNQSINRILEYLKSFFNTQSDDSLIAILNSKLANVNESATIVQFTSVSQVSCQVHGYILDKNNEPTQYDYVESTNSELCGSIVYVE